MRAHPLARASVWIVQDTRFRHRRSRHDEQTNHVRAPRPPTTLRRPRRDRANGREHALESWWVVMDSNHRPAD
jgi:hypothetical protein